MRDGWTPGALLDGEPRVWRSRSGYTVRRMQPAGFGQQPWLLYAWAPPQDDEPPRDGFLGAFEDGAAGFAAAERACRAHWGGVGR